MASILDLCDGATRKVLDTGTVLLTEGSTSGQLYVLSEGSVEVLRGDTQVAVIGEPGAVFGEMSVLLNRPHTATVRLYLRSACSCSTTPQASSSPIPTLRSCCAHCSPSVSTRRRPILPT